MLFRETLIEYFPDFLPEAKFIRNNEIVPVEHPDKRNVKEECSYSVSYSLHRMHAKSDIKVMVEVWRDSNGLLSRHTDDPSVIVREYGSLDVFAEFYFWNGNLSRHNKPAYILRDGIYLIEAYFQNGVLHRDEYAGPAFKETDLTDNIVYREAWLTSGVAHRTFGLT